VSKGGLERSQITELNRLKWTLWESEDTRIDPTRPAYTLSILFFFFFFFHHFSRDTKNAFADPILLKAKIKNISNLTFSHSFTYILRFDNSEFFLSLPLKSVQSNTFTSRYHKLISQQFSSIIYFLIVFISHILSTTFLLQIFFMFSENL